MRDITCDVITIESQLNPFLISILQPVNMSTTKVVANLYL